MPACGGNMLFPRILDTRSGSGACPKDHAHVSKGLLLLPQIRRYKLKDPCHDEIANLPRGCNKPAQVQCGCIWGMWAAALRRLSRRARCGSRHLSVVLGAEQWETSGHLFRGPCDKDPTLKVIFRPYRFESTSTGHWKRLMSRDLHSPLLL